MTQEIPSTAVFTFNTVFKTMEVFSTHAGAIARCPGLEIAEGDWLFFAADGTPLEAVLSVDPIAQKDGRWVLSNGVYAFGPSKGPGLAALVFNMCQGTDGLWISTFAELQARFRAS